MTADGASSTRSQWRVSFHDGQTDIFDEEDEALEWRAKWAAQGEPSVLDVRHITTTQTAWQTVASDEQAS